MPLNRIFRTALVTGAASGLGAAFAAMLRAEGVQVWGTSRQLARVPDGPDFRGLEMDLADRDSLAEAWRAAEAQSGGIDLLVNNAGAGLWGAYEGLPASAIERQWAVLMQGPADLTRLALQAMRVRGAGGIVQVTSLAVEFPIPYMAPYVSAKAGLAGLAAALVLETHGTGVRVLDFRPGDFRTGFNRAVERAGTGDEKGRAARVWRRQEVLMAGAPEPERAARDLRRALAAQSVGVVRSGSFFQARIAPMLARFASPGLSRWVQRRYFHLS